MARVPNEKAEKAKELYDKGMKLIDIANELDVPPGTVRRWKSSYNWDDVDKSERSDKKANNKSERSVKKMNKKVIVSKIVEPVVEEVLKDSKLTDKQKLFCIYYANSFNATQSYLKAYGCSYATALTEGPALKNNPRVSSEIDRIKAIKLTEAHLEPGDVFQKYMNIAFADITDYIQFGKKWVEARDGSEIEVNYVDLKDSTQIDGSLISEVSQGKDGVKIKLADKKDALKWLADHMDLATEEQRARIDNLHAKNQINVNVSETNRELDELLRQRSERRKSNA